MPRHYVDCREMPSESGCTLAISADTQEELLEAAAAHAVAVHGHTDGPELREGLAGVIHEGTAP
jgi:predicted small metal-binding protein